MFARLVRTQTRMVARRSLHATARVQASPFPGLPNPFPVDNPAEPEADDPTEKRQESQDKQQQQKKKRGGPEEKSGRDIFIKCLETAGIMVASISCLGLAGITYHRGYHWHALNKMEKAFAQGDPAFELTMHSRTTQEEESGWVVRQHQQLIDDVISGKTIGRYYLLIGEKGTGKTSMILEAMNKIQGKNCTFLEVHKDIEITRIRLGKALNFEFHEDYLGALFSIRGPRDTTALLDIERAFNRLEQVAVKHRKKHNRPLVLVINNAHLIRNDEDGQDLIELLQQKAEALSGAGLATLVFNSDDYWLYERLKRLGTRLEVVTVNDLSRSQSVMALQRARRKHLRMEATEKEAHEIYNLIGGRPQHLASVASKPDMVSAAHRLIDKEKTWFLNQCGLLGEEMDDDVMESGKFSTSAMFLVREMVKIDREQRLKEKSSGELATSDHELVKVPLWRARQIMTRPDYIQQYDNLNIFTIDSHSMVKADSVPMMQAFHEIAAVEGFDELLDETADRVSAIESLGRTRELVAKDLVQNGTYKIGVDYTGKLKELAVRLQQPEDIEDDSEVELDDGFKWLENEQSHWWTERSEKFGHNRKY